MGKKGDLVGLLLVGVVLLLVVGNYCHYANFFEQLDSVKNETAKNSTLLSVMYNETGDKFYTTKYIDDNSANGYVFDSASYLAFDDLKVVDNTEDTNDFAIFRIDNPSGLLVFQDVDSALGYFQKMLVGGKIYLHVDEVDTDMGVYRNVYVRLDDIQNRENITQTGVVYCYLGGRRDITCYVRDKDTDKMKNIHMSGDFTVIEYEEFSGNLWQEVLHGLFDTLGLYDAIAFAEIRGWDTSQFHFHADDVLKRLPIGKNYMRYVYVGGAELQKIRISDISTCPVFDWTEALYQDKNCWKGEGSGLHERGIRCNDNEELCYLAVSSSD